MKKRVLFVIAVVCLFIAIGIIVVPHFGGGSDEGGKADLVQMLCVNPACAKALEMTQNDYAKLLSENGSPATPMMTMPVFKCPNCQQNTLYIAMKCEKCGNIFVPNYKNPTGYDKCPKCGFSESQEQK